MNGIISNTRAKNPKVHALNEAGQPRCGAVAVCYSVSYPVDPETHEPVLNSAGYRKQTRKAVRFAPTIQTDLGQISCARCKKLAAQ